MQEKYKNVFSHLSEKDVNEIIDLFYNSDIPINEIINTYHIEGIRNSELYKCFPPIITEKKCLYCDTILVIDRESRSSSNYSYSTKEYCPSCGHIVDEQCLCKHCVEKRKAIKLLDDEKKLAFLKNHISQKSYTPFNYEILTLEQKIYLGTFLKAGIAENYESIMPIYNCSDKIFPTQEFLSEAYDELTSIGVLKIHPLSQLSCFTPDYENNTFSYDWQKVHLCPNIKSQQGYEKAINELLNPPIWNEIYTYELIDVWKKIIYHECIDLFKYRMDAYNFNYTIGKETKGFFEDIINNFPLSQIYSIIWNGAKNAAAYYQEGRVPRHQAANSVLSRMRGCADKIIAGQWNRFDYSRPKECPASIVSQYFFDSVIKICDQGWYKIPCVLNKPDGNISIS